MSITIPESKLCQRCRSTQATIFCQNCSPINNFCSKCDTSLHSLASKQKHLRVPLKGFSNYNPTNDKNIFLSPTGSDIQKQNQSISSKLPPPNLEILERSTSKINDFKKVYTKEYVDELMQIHEKEKGELMFKISTLENTLDRLKMSFNEQIIKMQSKIDSKEKENSNLLKNMTDQSIINIKKIEAEKNLQIDNQQKEIEKIEKEKKELQQNSNYFENEYKNFKEENEKERDNLIKQLNQTKENFEKYKGESESKFNKIRNEYQNKMDSLSKEIEDKYVQMNVQNKIALDNMANELNEAKTIKFRLESQLDENNQKFQKIFAELTDESQQLKKELKIMQEENNSLYDKFKNLNNQTENYKSQNENLLNIIQKLEGQLNRKNEENIFLENTINSLKNRNSILQDKNNQLSREYNSLISTAECMNFEYASKVKSLNGLEDKYFILERENNDLRNKINRFVRPYSFNK